jgi:hypothetical protein
MADKKDETKSDEPVIGGSAKLDERFKFGPPAIQTPEDATMAFLREEISEDEYRTALGKFGILPGQIMKTGAAERPDVAFKNSIPDDIYDEQAHPQDDLDKRLEAVKAEEDERNKATKEAEKNEPLKVTEVPNSPTPVSSNK